MSEQTKVCSKCRVAKPLDLFYRSKSGSLGVNAYCKSCSSAYSKARWPDVYSVNRDREIARSTAWQKENAERYKERLCSWKEKNWPRLLEKNRHDKKRHRNELYDCYVAVLIRLPKSLLSADLIEMKREQLKLHRAMKQLNEAITNKQENTK